MDFLSKDDTFADFNVVPAPVAVRERPSEAVFEAAIENFAEQQLRADAMGIALAFVDAGDYTSETLQGMIFGFLDFDEEAEELGDEDHEAYSSLAMGVVDAFAALGASEDNAIEAIEGDDGAAERLGDFVSGKIQDNPKSDDEIVATFAVEAGMVLEAVKRVVRDGVVKMIRVPVRRKRLSSAQRMALRKARMKANTSAAKRARAKSMGKRASRGM